MAQTIILTRHADARHGSTRDELRPLSERGRKQAERLAPKLRSFLEDAVVLCSTATRARQTAELLTKSVDVELLEFSELYWGDEDDLIRLIPLGERPVLVVGHAPSVPMAASLLASGSGRDLIATRGCPTATSYIFEVPEETDHLGWGSLNLLDIIITPS